MGPLTTDFMASTMAPGSSQTPPHCNTESRDTLSPPPTGSPLSQKCHRNQRYQSHPSSLPTIICQRTILRSPVGTLEQAGGSNHHNHPTHHQLLWHRSRMLVTNIWRARVDITSWSLYVTWSMTKFTAGERSLLWTAPPYLSNCSSTWEHTLPCSSPSPTLPGTSRSFIARPLQLRTRVHR